MKKTTAALACGIGLIAGLRSMMAPAILSHRLASMRRLRRVHGPAAWLRAPLARRALPVLAVGEVIADKTPAVPDRIEPPSIVGRTGSGALCGAAIAEWRGDPMWMGAAWGAAGALASTFGAFHLRRAAGRALPLPDPVLGAVEDGVALWCGSRLVSGV